MDLEVTGQSIEFSHNDLVFPVFSPSQLSDNFEFNDLKQKLEEYQPDTSKWTELVHSSLTSLLAEVAYTKDKNIQESLLNKVSKWYYQKIRSRKVLPKLNIASVIGPAPSKKRPSKGTYRGGSVRVRVPSPVNAVSPVKAPKLRAFAEPASELEPAVMLNLNKKFEQMRRREKEKLEALQYRDNALAEWSQLKQQRATLLEYKLQLLRQRRQARKRPGLSLSLENAKLFNFSLAEDASDSSVDSEVEDLKYSHMSPVGTRRWLMSTRHPIDSSRPTPRQSIPQALSAFAEVVPQPPKQYPATNRNAQLQEALDSRAKLARTTAFCDYNALELALVTPDETQVVGAGLPKGGEHLPRLVRNKVVKSKKKKKKEK